MIFARSCMHMSCLVRGWRIAQPYGADCLTHQQKYTRGHCFRGSYHPPGCHGPSPIQNVEKDTVTIQATSVHRFGWGLMLWLF